MRGRAGGGRAWGTRVSQRPNGLPPPDLALIGFLVASLVLLVWAALAARRAGGLP